MDTSIVNSYLISKKLEITQDHKSFRLELIHQLIKDSINNNNSLKRTTWSDDQSINEDDHNTKKIRVSTHMNYHCVDKIVITIMLNTERKERHVCNVIFSKNKVMEQF